MGLKWTALDLAPLSLARSALDWMGLLHLEWWLVGWSSAVYYLCLITIVIHCNALQRHRPQQQQMKQAQHLKMRKKKKRTKHCAVITIIGT